MRYKCNSLLQPRASFKSKKFVFKYFTVALLNSTDCVSERTKVSARVQRQLAVYLKMPYCTTLFLCNLPCFVLMNVEYQPLPVSNFRTIGLQDAYKNYQRQIFISISSGRGKVTSLRYSLYAKKSIAHQLVQKLYKNFIYQKSFGDIFQAYH